MSIHAPDVFRRCARWWPLTVLALLGYVPALASSPGRMPADSKLFVYLDPGRFFADAASSFDPGLYGGWVPHQHISYLWPVLPYYWTADALGVPDWVAHRIWIGTLFFAAGTGVWWCVRQLGFAAGPALAAAAIYQCSPYVLPYVSRTSVMLLPWAGLGWIVGCTIRAVGTHDAASTQTATIRQRWRYPARIALVVFTVGAVNATALAMVAPAPAVWLAYAAATRLSPWRSVVAVAARTAGLCLAVSLWWIVMLVIQGRFGAPVLPYSETLQDVSFTSSANEVWRALGYWLFYVRDVAAPTTSASLPYLVSGFQILLSFAPALIGLAGLAATDFVHRRFAYLLIGVGGVLAVGVYPFGDSSPIMSWLTGDGSTGVALALRSSTRALPMLVLGLALGVAALCQAMRLRPKPAVFGNLAAAVFVGVAAMNLPALRHHQLVDPAISRDEQPPQPWLDAARRLDELGASGRVLQVPGVEFGVYRWGFTVDQPVAGLTAKPLLTRDLLPLGSAGMMDVLYALDDRIQAGTLTPEQVRSAARWMGTDTVWLTGDLAFERFNTARPSDLVDTVTALGTADRFGEPTLNTPTFKWVDERSLARPQRPVPPVTLVRLEEPNRIVRAATQLVGVAGSGDGLIDAVPVSEAAVGKAVTYTADLDRDQLADLDVLVVTDSNRNRDRQWRGAKDAVGATLTTADPVSDQERSQRLAVFDNVDPATQTVSVQQGPVTAYADRYGEPFGFQPEHRAAMAIDGNPDTAWTVGEHGDPVGATLSLRTTTPIERLRLDQFVDVAHQRTISEVTVRVSDGTSTTVTRRVALDTSTEIDLDAPAGSTISIQIATVSGGEPNTEGIVADVGFTEVNAAGPTGELAPTVEWVRLPIASIEASRGRRAPAVAYSMTRERVSPTNHWRADPEPRLRRMLTVAATERFSAQATVRLDALAPDEQIAEVLGVTTSASSRLAGSLRHLGAAATDGDEDTAWISAFGDGVGTSLTVTLPTPLTTLRLTQPDPTLSQIRGITVSAGGVVQRRNVSPDSTGASTVRFDPPLPSGDATITIDRVEPATTIDRRFGDLRQLPVSISELSFNGISPAQRPLQHPITTDCVALYTVDETTFSSRLRIDPAALDGEPVEAQECQADVELGSGEHRIEQATPAGFQLDGLDLRSASFMQRTSQHSSSRPNVVDVTGNRFNRTISLSGCDNGCWLVFGEGYNSGWTASVNGRRLGPPRLLDGTSNGWWIDPAATDHGEVTVAVSWPPQRAVTGAIGASIASVVLCAWLMLGRGGGANAALTVRPRLRGTRRGWRWSVVVAGAAPLLAWLFVGPIAIPAGLVVGAVVVATRSGAAVRVAPLVLVAVTAAVVIRREVDNRFVPDARWPSYFGDWHWIAMTAFALTILAALLPTSRAVQSDEQGPVAASAHDERRRGCREQRTPGAAEP